MKRQAPGKLHDGVQRTARPRGQPTQGICNSGVENDGFPRDGIPHFCFRRFPVGRYRSPCLVILQQVLPIGQPCRHVPAMQVAYELLVSSVLYRCG